MNDVKRLRQALIGVEESAKDLRWAEERPWHRDTHVWDEAGLAVVDLHDLNARVAREAAKAVHAVADKLEAGAVLFVVGVGRRSAGPPVLRSVVMKALSGGPFKVRLAAQGRIALISDANKAPAAATGAMGLGMALLWLLFALAAAFAVAQGCLPERG